MDESLVQICDDFVSYSDEIKQSAGIFTNHYLLNPIGAYIFLASGERPNKEMFQLCKRILSDYAGSFSYFKGAGEVVFASLLAVAEDPGKKMSLALAAYDALKQHFFASATLPLLALIMADVAHGEHYYEIALKTKDVHHRMNKEHLLLTGNEDITFAGLLAMTPKDPQTIIEESEYLYSCLKDGPSLSSNARQTASHVLTLCAGELDYRYVRFLELTKKIKDKLRFIYHDYEMIPLAILANLGLDLEKVADDFAEVFYYLKEYPEYHGIFGLSKRRRFLHTALILSAYYLNDNIELLSAVTICAILEILAQQAAAAA